MKTVKEVEEKILTTSEIIATIKRLAEEEQETIVGEIPSSLSPPDAKRAKFQKESIMMVPAKLINPLEEFLNMKPDELSTIAVLWLDKYKFFEGDINNFDNDDYYHGHVFKNLRDDENKKKVEQFLEKLKHCTGLQKVYTENGSNFFVSSFNHEGMPAEYFDQLMQVLQNNCPNISELSLCDSLCFVSENHIKEMKFANVRKLNLKNNFLFNNLYDLFNLIKKCPKLEILDMSEFPGCENYMRYNDFNVNSLKMLKEVLTSCPMLRKLKFDGMNIYDAIALNKAGSIVNEARSIVDDKQMIAFVEMLKAMPKLQELSLKDCNLYKLEPRIMSILFEGILSCKNLRILDIEPEVY